MPLSRDHDQFVDLVRTVLRSSRIRLAWTQRELSRRSGVPQSRISEIERARCPRIRSDDVDRLFSAIGIHFWLSVSAPTALRTADAVHARCSAYVQRRLEASDWQVLREVEIGGDRSRGWIDLVAFDPRTGTLLIIEIKTELDDIGRVERQLSWYEREAWRLARRRGWRARRTIGVVLALDSEANHRVVGHQRAALAVALPGRATALRAITTHDSVPSLARYLAFIDPRSRRANWILASGTDGRRTRPAFVDYIDAVRRLEKPDGRLGAPHSRST